MFAGIIGGITVRVIYSLVSAFLLTILFTPWAIRRLKRMNVGQYIREEGVDSHKVKGGIPTMGGVVMLSAIFVSSVLWARPLPQVWLVLGVLLLLGALGTVDDILKVSLRDSAGLPGRFKLLGQSVVAACAGIYLWMASWMDPSVFVPLTGRELDLGWLYVPFCVLVVVGASNAVNLTDGLDGLAVGVLIPVAVCYGGIAYVAGNTIFSAHLAIPYVAGDGELAIICSAMVGACLGFLWYNSHPASVFMGDTGSLALGGAVGMVAVLTKNELLLVVIGGIFVIEALSVIIQVASYRLFRRRVFRMSPLHHHFELSGWSEPKVVVRFWILTLVLALMGISILGLNSMAMHRGRPGSVRGHQNRITATSPINSTTARSASRITSTLGSRSSSSSR